jgi:Ca-activated chloride channel family protein
MLNEVSIGLPGRKTDLGQAIGMTVKLLRPEEQGERLLILISDGEVNSGEIAATDAADLAARLGVKILTIGFATEIAAENVSQLAEVSQMTGGAYRVATDAGLMQDALDWLDDMAPIIPDQAVTERRTDWRWLPLIIALACLLAIGWREYRDP